MVNYYLTPGAILDSSNLWNGQQDIADDILSRWGTSGDGVVLNRSDTHNANTTLTDVIIGTPVVLEMPPNTLIISNITNDGDIVLIGSRSNNSLEYLRVDTSAETIQISKDMDFSNTESIFNVLEIEMYRSTQIRDSHTNNVLAIWGGSANTAGRIDLYGQSHGSKPYEVEILCNTTVMAGFDDGALGFFAVTPQAQQATIADADGTLADITTKFNTLLADLEGYGFLAT